MVLYAVNSLSGSLGSLANTFMEQVAASGRLVLETHISFVNSPSDVELPRGVVAGTSFI